MNRGRYHHGDLSQTLIALALEDLERGGPEALSVSALAKRAGVSPMAPYRHFADKDALLEALARRGFGELREAMGRVDDSDPLAAITAFGICYVEFAVARPGLFRVMYGHAPPTPDEGLAEDSATVLGLYAERMSALVSPERLADACLAGWCLMHGLASLCVAGRIRGPLSGQPGDLARRMAAMIGQAISIGRSR